MKKDKEKGFTLMETVVTIAIFGIVTMLSVGIFNVAYGVQKRASDVTKKENEIMHRVEVQGTKTYFVGDFEIVFEGKPVAPIRGEGSGISE